MVNETVPVVLVPHDPAWAEQAATETARLAVAIGDNLLFVHHIGSTAIDGILAKPTIDLLPVVRRLDELDAVAEAVQALGYVWRGEFGLPGRRFCLRQEGGRRLFHLHAYAAGSSEIARHLAFRDYLRAHPDQALAYEAEKRRAAALHPDDSLAYNGAKNDWIKACEARALAWRAAAHS